MRLLLRPLDTLFFRDGKPFSMGEESWADGVFPPYPSVIYGALRTWYISNQAGDITRTLIERSGQIQITGIHYRLSDGLRLPMPLDLVEPKGEVKDLNGEYKVFKLLLEEQIRISNSPLVGRLVSPERTEVESVEDGLITRDDFALYLDGYVERTKIIKLADIVQSEPKVGIGRDDSTNTADDGKLYRVGMRRATGFDMIVEAVFPDEQMNSTFIKVGGEGKVAAVEVRRGRNLDSLQIDGSTISLKQGAFKLYLATPAIFIKGWQPDLERFGIKAELIAAVVGKPVHIGGFDMLKRKPKPMYKAAPAGSVYYYRTHHSSEEILEILQGKSVSDLLSEQGFGISYVGNF